MAAIESRMLLGIQPTGWTNDDFQEIGDKTPYQSILRETAETGFVGGSTGHNYPKHLPSLLKALDQWNLRIAATWAGTRFTQVGDGADLEVAFREFTDQVKFLEDVEAKDVVVAELAGAVNQIRTKAVLTDRPVFSEAQWYLLTSQLDRAGRYAADRKMKLSYHPHVGTGVMALDETARLLDSTDPDTVGLCLDTAHLRYGGAGRKELVEFTKKYATRITHVHLKNVRRSVLPVAIKTNYSFYQAIKHGIFTVPGDHEGDLDLAPILEILKDVGYDRWLIVEAEQDPDKRDPVQNKSVTPRQYAAMAREFLHKHLGY